MEIPRSWSHPTSRLCGRPANQDKEGIPTWSSIREDLTLARQWGTSEGGTSSICPDLLLNHGNHWARSDSQSLNGCSCQSLSMIDAAHLIVHPGMPRVPHPPVEIRLGMSARTVSFLFSVKEKCVRGQFSVPRHQIWAGNLAKSKQQISHGCIDCTQNVQYYSPFVLWFLCPGNEIKDTGLTLLGICELTSG